MVIMLWIRGESSFIIGYNTAILKLCNIYNMNDNSYQLERTEETNNDT